MRCVIVTGVGTCGTSAAAGALYQMAVPMGQELKPSSKVNPRGYFEDEDYRTCTYVKGKGPRYEAMRGWAKRRVASSKGIWGVKGPYFLGNWKQTLEAIQEADPDADLRVILLTRPIEEVARSKMEKYPREGEVLEDFIKKVKVEEDRSRAFFRKFIRPVLVLPFCRLVQDREGSVWNMARFAFFGTPFFPSDEQIQSAIDFIEPELKHF